MYMFKNLPLNTKHLTQYELDIVKKSWASIEKNIVSNFHILKNNGSIEEINSLIWFFNIFYKNIKNSKKYYNDVFKNSNFVFQSKALVNIIHNSIRVSSNIINKNKIDFYKIDEIHSRMGITIPHYLMTIEILLNSLEECLGQDEWDRLLRASWLKVLNITVENIKYIQNTYYYYFFVNLYRKTFHPTVFPPVKHCSLSTVSPE